MILAHVLEGGRAKSLEIEAGEARPPHGCLWLDLVAPTAAEEKTAEDWLGLDLPTREEMREIEASSRLYEDRGAHFMTATLVASSETDRPVSSAVTFVLTERVLVTIRYAEPTAFKTFKLAIERQPGRLCTPPVALSELLDAVVDRLADILERVESDLESVSHTVFEDHANVRGREFVPLIGRIGRNGDLISKVRESLVSIRRLEGFARRVDSIRRDETASAQLETLEQDIQSLMDHATFLNGKVDFLLSATLGKIGIEQNATIKIFSVVAVVFLPPTLIASIYGMNFEYMPELEWVLGYPAALVAMVVAAVAPYWLFKRVGWL